MQISYNPKAQMKGIRKRISKNHKVVHKRERLYYLSFYDNSLTVYVVGKDIPSEVE